MSGPAKLSTIKSPNEFVRFQQELGTDLPWCDSLPQALALGHRLEKGALRIGNRFAILPMEGWDGTYDGNPTELTRRRWRRFGESGAKLVWGGEAVAVRPDGRANPNQLLGGPRNAAGLADLRRVLCEAHEAAYGGLNGLFVGLQLTHSGRFARPEGAPAPRIAYRHPLLDARVPIGNDEALLTDAELDDLIGEYARLAVLAQNVGFDFVDVKACHGYLLHEFLSARSRPGPYGGDLAGRTRLLRRIIRAVQTEAPGLVVGVRLSAFDDSPFAPGGDGRGVPQRSEVEPFGPISASGSPSLEECSQLLRAFERLDVRLVCVTGGSPYYNPHLQRPAFYPPSDGYLPPEDPLVGVDRQIRATAELKRRHPGLVFVGSGYTYLQEWLPNVAEAAVAQDATDFVGLGRMALSYPTLPRDVLSGHPLRRKRICRTFSDCTTAPRNGMVSGCYPLDEHYKSMPDAKTVRGLVQRWR